MPLPRRSMDYRYFEDDPEADGMMPLEGPAVRRGIPRYMDRFDGLSQDEELDAMLGIDAPELDAFEPEEFDADPLDSFLERMSAGGVPQGLQKPRGFLQGLVSGVATGAVNRGQRVGERRKKFETNQATRAAERDKNNLQATRDYKKERGTALRDLTKSQREDRRKQEEYARDNPPLTPALQEVAPWLARTFKPGENVPKDIYQGILKNMSPEAIAEIERKKAGDARDQRRLGIAEEELTMKRTEAGKPGGGKPPTEFQARAQFFRSRAKEATVNAVKGGLEGRVLNKAWSLVAPPAMQGDPDVREYWRAMESFSLALNRLESGAAIAPTEFAKVRQLYFVAPGDKAADVKAKVKMREALIENLSNMQSAGVQAEQSAAGDGGGGAVTPAQLWEP